MNNNNNNNNNNKFPLSTQLHILFEKQKINIKILPTFQFETLKIEN